MQPFTAADSSLAVLLAGGIRIDLLQVLQRALDDGQRRAQLVGELAAQGFEVVLVLLLALEQVVEILCQLADFIACALLWQRQRRTVALGVELL